MTDEMFKDSNGVWWNKGMFESEELIRTLRETNAILAEMWPISRETIRTDLLSRSKGELNAVEFLNDLKLALKQLSREARATAVLEITGYAGDYGEDPAIEVYHERQETDEELKARKEEAQRQHEQRTKDNATQQEKSERTMLANLKAKYEP